MYMHMDLGVRTLHLAVALDHLAHGSHQHILKWRRRSSTVMRLEVACRQRAPPPRYHDLGNQLNWMSALKRRRGLWLVDCSHELLCRCQDLCLVGRHYIISLYIILHYIISYCTVLYRPSTFQPIAGRHNIVPCSSLFMVMCTLRGVIENPLIGLSSDPAKKILASLPRKNLRDTVPFLWV
jgi:hypothetical protein